MRVHKRDKTFNFIDVNTFITRFGVVEISDKQINLLPSYHMLSYAVSLELTPHF